MTLPALVTGASRGLGHAVALALAPARHVIAVARTVGGLEELDDAIAAKGGTATLAPLDVTNDGAMQHLCRDVFDRWGGVSLWVHCAIHAPPLTPAAMIDVKDFEKSMGVNAGATRRLIAFVAPLLRDRGTAVFLDDPMADAKHAGTYGASKRAQIALARAWAQERTSPSVVVHTPAPMPTALRARFFPGEDRKRLTPCADEAARLLAALPALEAGAPGP